MVWNKKPGFRWVYVRQLRIICDWTSPSMFRIIFWLDRWLLGMVSQDGNLSFGSLTRFSSKFISEKLFYFVRLLKRMLIFSLPETKTEKSMVGRWFFCGDGQFSEAMLVSGSVCRGFKNTKFFEESVYYIAVKWHLPSQKSKIKILFHWCCTIFPIWDCPFELKKAKLLSSGRFIWNSHEAKTWTTRTQWIWKPAITILTISIITIMVTILTVATTISTIWYYSYCYHDYYYCYCHYLLLPTDYC